MNDAAELVRLIKRAAVEAVEAQKPMSLCFGRVISRSPIKISVEQKMVLGKNQLIYTDRLDSASIGDEVVLLRADGGQRFVVIDRICGEGQNGGTV